MFPELILVKASQMDRLVAMFKMPPLFKHLWASMTLHISL
jgi:hypothetical protein